MTRTEERREDWLSLERAAELAGVTPLHLLLHLRRGLLRGEADGESWRIEPRSLAALLRARGQGKGETVCASGCGSSSGCKGCG